MKEVKVGVIGYGTIGSGVVRILTENAELIRKRLGFSLTLGKVADLDIETDRGVDLSRDLLTTDAGDIISDPELPLVVELIGGLEPARTMILDALGAGKYVVTANKALLAHHWEEIFGAAAANRGDVGFEAAVGGGIPVIRALRQGLAANRFQSIRGIINGTCNYILTRMSEEGEDFETVLRQAQEKGYAEADPTLDIDGTDAAHKLAILASLAFGTRVGLDEVYTEGIEKITLMDIEFARELGFVIKLLAVSREVDGQIEARVHPTLLPAQQMLATVGGAFNAVYIRGDAVGPSLYYGLGAGSMPTASAVVSDLMELAGRLVSGAPSPPVPAVGGGGAGKVLPMEEVVCPSYIRFMALDKPGVLAAVSGILAKGEISIASVIQKGRQAGGVVPIVMMTHESREASVRAALAEIGDLPLIAEAPSLIRVERGD